MLKKYKIVTIATKLQAELLPLQYFCLLGEITA